MLAAHGLSDQQIAERLFVSPLTVRTHVNRAVRELDARDRAQLVVIAYQQGPGPRAVTAGAWTRDVADRSARSACWEGLAGRLPQAGERGLRRAGGRAQPRLQCRR